jgi:hypothetical protein
VLQDSDNHFKRACARLRYDESRPKVFVRDDVSATGSCAVGWFGNRVMQKVIEFRGPKSEAAPEPLAPPPAMEPILAVVDSLSRTLNCIKTMCATEPNGPVRDKLETERANLVIGLFVARVAAMRLSSGEPALDEPNLSIASRG